MDQRTLHISNDSPQPVTSDIGGPSRPRISSYNRRPLMAVAAVLMLALLSAVLFGVLGQRPLHHGPAGSHAATATANPTVAPVHIPGVAIDPKTGLPKHSGFTQLQALGPDDLWGLGYFWQTEPSATQLGVSYSFFAHFDGQIWTVWPIPRANISLNSISMDSETDGWAVGTVDLGSPRDDLLVHYAYGQILQTHVPGAGNLLRVQMLSNTEGWAIGNAPSDGTQPISMLRPVTLHYVNGAWSLVANTLYPEVAADFSMDAPTHGWFLGGLGHLGYLAGVQWHQWHQAFNGTYLHSVSSISADDAWAVGNTTGTPSSQPAPVVLHFDGHAWVSVTLPALQGSAGVLLNQVTMVSPTDGWIMGMLLSPLSTQPVVETPLLLHYDGAQWRRVVSPPNVAIDSISMSSATDGWAIGWLTPRGAALYLCRYQNSRWSIVSRLG